MRRVKSLRPYTSLPSTDKIISEADKFAFAAGESGVISDIVTPPLKVCSALIEIGVLLATTLTPIQPLSTLPLLINSEITNLLQFTGIAKPIPILSPNDENNAVLIPITSPSILNRGPPEEP